MPESGHPAEIGIDLGGTRQHAQAFEEWELDQNLRSLEARLGSWPRQQSGPHFTPPPSRAPVYRFDAAHAGVPRPASSRRKMRIDRPARRTSLLAHGLLWLGLVALATGGGLLAFAEFGQQPALWQYGIPATAGGGGVFLVGLVWQLERIWRNSRFAVQKLRQLDSQLRQLEHTTSMLGVTHGPSSQAFYTHMAEGANPHMLLADLKGQIDMLAMNFSRR
jgi:hypothetical protein